MTHDTTPAAQLLDAINRWRNDNPATPHDSSTATTAAGNPTNTAAGNPTKTAAGNTLQGFTAALVDMDGTLYASMGNHARSWYRLMTEQGIECTPQEFYLYEGMTGAQTIARLWERDGRPAPSADDIARLYHTKTQYFNQLPQPTVMPGAQAVMQRLHELGLTTVLVTGSGQGSVLERLDDDYPGIFPPGRRITARDVTRGKPHPQPYLRAMEQAGSTPASSLVIENAPIGVRSGRASGAFTIGVNTGPLRAGTLSEEGAHVEFPDMCTLLAALAALDRV